MYDSVSGVLGPGADGITVVAARDRDLEFMCILQVP